MRSYLFALVCCVLGASTAAAQAPNTFSGFIAAAPVATTPFGVTDRIPIVQGGVTNATLPATTLSSLIVAAGSVVNIPSTQVAAGAGFQQGGATMLKVTGNSDNVGSHGWGTDTLVGLGAGVNLPTDDYLTTAVGWHALYSSTSTNTESTAVGWGSQQLITDGSQNTTLGINTLGTCVHCTHNILAGTDAMRNGLGSANVGIGVNALIDDSAGAQIAIGDQTLESNLSATGTFNIAIGWQTFQGLSLTTGSKNIAIGAVIADGATTAADNVLIGHLVGGGITSSFQNTVIGSQAAKSLAGVGIDTIIGYNAAQTCTTCKQSTIIGASVGSTTYASGQGVILIGSGKGVVDTPAAGTSDYLNLGNILITTGTDIPATSVTTIAGLMKLGNPVVVASLPTCNAGAKYQQQAVTDLTAPAWGIAAVGGGAVAGQVMCNGTNWIVMVASSTPNTNRKILATIGTTASATFVMAGANFTLTPHSSGVVRFALSGQGVNGTPGDGGSIQMYYGTGTPPANGDAPSGTATQVVTAYTDAAGGSNQSVSLNTIISGLTPGTTYWFDLGQEAVGGGTIQLFNTNFTLEELH